ncbi:MAG: phosphatidate cytidylyltransferase [Burkholderiaceae bacterium]|nr:phosphatidate cytidylyltransferase [Burkholderiaceae bacterium]
MPILITRAITALVLFGALMALLFSGYPFAFEVVLTVFFALASWESFRLFGNAYPVWSALLWTPVFPLIIYTADLSRVSMFLSLCVILWCVRFAPTLKFSLPPMNGTSNKLLAGMYGAALLAFFVGVYELYLHSPLFLLSIISIVIIADTGAYAFGSTFGKHKLAPKISPSKTWEGAIGGWFSVLVVSVISTMIPALEDTFAVKFQQKLGWFGMFAILTVLVACSVVGDLFESRLKRRAGVKDSSNLLPGHGGVLDRIDALVPVLPLASLLDLWI